MGIEITLRNFRCFPESRPATLRMGKGFTALVGVNNSGKSSLLKFFYEFRSLFHVLADPQSWVHLFRGGGLGCSFPPSVFDPNEVFSDGNAGDLRIEFRPCLVADQNQPTALPVPQRLVLRIRREDKNVFLEPDIAYAANLNTLTIQGTVLQDGNGRALAELGDYFKEIAPLTEVLYIGPFRNAINVGSNEDYFDIAVGASFIQKWREYKTGNWKKFNEDAFRLVRDVKRIFDFDVFEINPSSDGRTLQLIINGKSYKLTELGSGLTQFILVLANAITKRPSYILIDEPELNLHPSLQLDFLTTPASYAREGIIFGTHSVGLARASADRVYAVRRIAQGESEIVDFEGLQSLSEFLGELSFSGYRELGFNKILLVEGPNEIRTIQQFLRLYRKDHQIVLLPLGGSGMINGRREPELREIKRISENVFALIDSERSSPDALLEPNRQSFVEACGSANIKCHVLKLRAIENYLTQNAVVQIKGDKYRALGPYERLKDANPAWSKAENWRIAREMSSNDVSGTDLGEFLASI